MYAGWLVYNLATSSLKNDANSTQKVSLLRSETNVKLAIGTGIRSMVPQLWVPHRIHGTGIFTYMKTIENKPKCRENIPVLWILWVPWSTNRQMTRFAYGILLATMVQFLALGWYGLVTCSSYDGVKAETFRGLAGWTARLCCFFVFKGSIQYIIMYCRYIYIFLILVSTYVFILNVYWLSL